jgi:4-amino-4-deoxy-L-arabinose transferase-like glycosyltransferase
MKRPTTTRIARSGIGWRDHALGMLIALSYLGLLLVTAPALGMARDEGIYVIAANRYAEWYELLGTDRARALEPAVVDRHWEFNHEHPALMKTFFTWSVLADRKFHVFETPSQAYRFPGMVTGSLLLWLVYIFGARTVGRGAGVFAAIALGLMPQYFYHAHLACFDVPIAFFLTLVVYTYFRSLSEARWSIAVGITYGLALATKHNAWILPGILLVHFVWMSIAEIQRRRRTGTKNVSLVPWWLGAMVLMGPPIFVGTWPWLWQNTEARALEYAQFHLQHEYYNMAYFGLNYYRPPFPISYPFVMTLFTVPLTTLVLAAFAFGSRLPTFAPWPLGRLFNPERLRRRDILRTDVLFVGCLLAPLVVIALPSTPIFGGTKHWLAAYPFLALYAGWAARRAIRRLRALAHGLAPSLGATVRTGAAALMLAPSFVETLHSHPFGLGHYTWAAGFTPGAADHGMNRQFWGYTTGSLGEFVTTHLPEGGSLWICDTLPESFMQLKRDGVIPANVEIAWSMADADYAIVHHEHHFAEIDGQLWVAYGSSQPAFVLTHDGVPFVSVYENPTRRARHGRPRR